MGIYFTLSIAIVLCPMLFLKSKLYSKRAQKYTCILIFIMMLCVMGLRSEQLGMYDVEYVYLPMFRNVQNLSFAGVFRRYPFLRGNLLQLLTKVFTIFSQNEHLWIFVTSVPCLAALAHLIMKYGNNRYSCAFSFFMFIGLRIYGANFYLIRHSFAMAFLILAFEAILERKPRKFVLLVLCATLFHTTACLFIIAYPLARINISFKQLGLLFGGFLFATYLAKDALNGFFSLIDSGNYYYNYINKTGFSSNIFILITLILFAIAYLLCMNNGYMRNTSRVGNIGDLTTQQKDQDVCMITVNVLWIAVFFMAMSKTISEFQRVAFFFLAVSLVGFGNIIHHEKNKVVRCIIYMALFVLLLFFMSNALEPEMLSPYHTFF